MSEHVYLQYN